jgi:phosphatidate cytidylyltransferase
MDMGAYFTGRKWGQHKLCPSISPNKTWEGLAGGVAAATLVGVLFAFYMNIPKILGASVIISPTIAVIAQIGDLFKSWIKRKAGVKDSGTLLPGHGGLLDRMDSYLFAAPVLSLIVYFALRAVS